MIVEVVVQLLMMHYLMLTFPQLPKISKRDFKAKDDEVAVCYVDEIVGRVVDGVPARINPIMVERRDELREIIPDSKREPSSVDLDNNQVDAIHVNQMLSSGIDSNVQLRMVVY